MPQDPSIFVQDPTYKRGTCDGTQADPMCPIHGSGPPWPVDEAVCVGRRYWTCKRCNAFTAGSACRNCGFGASLLIWEAGSPGFTDDVLRRVRPQEETDGALLVIGYEDASQPDPADEVVGEAALDVQVPVDVPPDHVVG